MNEKFISMLNDRIKPLRKFVDEDQSFEMLIQTEHTSTEIEMEYIRCINVNNVASTYLKEINLIKSKLTEAKFHINTSTPKGSAELKQVNIILSTMDHLKEALEYIYDKYNKAIRYYERLPWK